MARTAPDAATFGAAIAEAYATKGGAVELGTGMLDGALVPEAAVRVPLAMMNRHGLIAGATGTGKTKTLQVIAEQLSAAGVPVFVADVKGDVSGMAVAGLDRRPGAEARGRARPRRSRPTGFPVEFLVARRHRPRRAGARDRLRLRPAAAREGPRRRTRRRSRASALVFHYADEKGLPLLDLSDLRALLTFLDSDAGKAELKGIGGPLDADGRRAPARRSSASRTAAATSSSASRSSTSPTCCAPRRTAAGSSRASSSRPSRTSRRCGRPR